MLAATTLLPFGAASAQTVDAGRRIADAANRFLGSLDDGQRQKALIAFESDNRLDWHYIPRSRRGLSLGEMRTTQAEAARALFGSVLNERGLQLLDGVRLLEGVLREQQGSFRDPGRYYVSVFGTPGRFPWGWRAEGHHLSLNMTLPAAGRIAVTPFFVGAHPATVRDGPNRGFRLLGASEDLARQIMTSLSDAQRQAAIIANRSFGEIVASPQRERDLGEPRGLSLGAMAGLSFGSPDRLRRQLGVEPGAVTPLALVNDEARAVRLALDRGLAEGGPINAHPLVNTMTTAIPTADLLRFFEATGHTPLWLDFFV